MNLTHIILFKFLTGASPATGAVLDAYCFEVQWDSPYPFCVQWDSPYPFDVEI